MAKPNPNAGGNAPSESAKRFMEANKHLYRSEKKPASAKTGMRKLGRAAARGGGGTRHATPAEHGRRRRGEQGKATPQPTRRKKAG